MTAKVLLISSSFEEVSLIMAGVENRMGEKTTDQSHYPLGLAYLHSYLESFGHNVRTLFLNNHSFESCFKIVVEMVEDFSPELVGLQLFSANRVSSYRLIEYIHEGHPQIALIVGGIHTTAMYKQLIEKYPYLIAVIGEGEIALSELVQELSNNRYNPDLMSIDGIAFRHGDSVFVTKPRKLIDNLDVLPFPKHELFINDERTSGCIITSRGCPFACSYCALHLVSQRQVRYRSVKNVVDEIEWMINKFPQITQLWIHDDSFFLDNRRAVEFCDEIIERSIQIDFVCSGRMKPLSKELVDKLERAGFKLVLLGLESGANKILKAAHKGETQVDAIHAFQLFAHSRIRLLAFLIVGLPGENAETVMETADFVKKLQRIKYMHYRRNAAALLSIYPGTEVYEIAKAGGMIDDEYWLSNEPVPLFTLENSLEQMLCFKEKLLNHISMDRLFTIDGLKAQFTMLPYIYRYKRSTRNLTDIAFKDGSQLLRRILPDKVFELIRKLYRFLVSKN